MAKVRKIPLRSCVGCREKKPKRELVRIVRTPEGEGLLDLTGKKSGRGVYICPREACFKQALKAKQLEKNLERSISEEVIAEITALLEQQEDGR